MGNLSALGLSLPAAPAVTSQASENLSNHAQTWGQFGPKSARDKSGRKIWDRGRKRREQEKGKEEKKVVLGCRSEMEELQEKRQEAGE